tara:strand:+ start:201 stop:1793 length:1593 start_codon:yes stop_codon:yes gene_type:complete
MNIENKNPSDIEIKNLIKEFQNGRLNIAIKLALSITERFPKHQFTWKILGVLFGITGKVHDAIQANQKAISLLPTDSESHNNLGNSLRTLGKINEAITSYKQDITLKPNYAEAHNNLAISLQGQGLLNEAIRSYKQAIALKPHYAEAFNNLALTQKELGKLEDSEINYKKAIELNPKYTEAYNNLALTQKELGKLEDSEINYKKAIELRPDYAEANFNLSILLNLKGNLKSGLKLYEWRLHKKERIAKAPRKELIWDGIETIKNKKFLVYEEQGIGDTIQFYRYLLLLQQKGAEVIFKVSPKLHNLFKSPDNKIQFVDTLDEGFKFNFETPLMSLPHLFKADIDKIPTFIPYVNVDAKKKAEWSKKLITDKFKVGICWQGSKKKIDVGRSFPLSYFKDISKIKGVKLISLYKGEDENKTFNLDFDLTTFENTFDEGNNAFIDTAAVIMNCDLVITSDTVIAHLAGALGKPVWVALKYIPDWRWMLKRSDSPWYPTMILYRQKDLNNWDTVFSSIKKDLIAIINQEKLNLS